MTAQRGDFDAVPAPSLRDKLEGALVRYIAIGPVRAAAARALLPLVEAEVAARVTQALETAAAVLDAVGEAPAIGRYLRKRAARNGGQA